MKRLYSIALVLCAIASPALAQDFHLTINNQSGIYKKGEKAVITCHMDKMLNDSLTIRISENNHQRTWRSTVSVLPPCVAMWQNL